MQSTKTRFYVAFFVLLLSLKASSQQPAKSAVRSWAGCYELSVAQSDEWRPGSGAVPRAFQLLDQPVEWHAFTAQRLDKRTDWFDPLRTGHVDDGRIWTQETPGKSWWQPASENAMTVVLVTRFVMYTAEIQRSESGLLGTAVAEPVSYSENGFLRARVEMNVGLKPIPCV